MYALLVKVCSGASELLCSSRCSRCSHRPTESPTLLDGEDGTPDLENDHLVIDGHELPADGVSYIGMIEPQNWCPPGEMERIFSRYAEMGGFSAETCGWHSETLRLTHFADVGAWKSNNGVISPDGRYMAFQESQGGFGQGWGRIYLLDLEAAGVTRR